MTTSRTTSLVPVGARISPAMALTEVVGLVREVATTVVQEATTRQRFSAELEADLRRVAATERIVLTHLDRSHQERAEVFRRYFDALDCALQTGDPALVAPILDGIATLAAASPFAELANLDAVRERLADRSAQWDL